MTAPKEYTVKGLEIAHYSKPNAVNEAVEYLTPKGTAFSLAKDFMGIQFCKGGMFWPPPFTAFTSMTEAVYILRSNTADAIKFFDEANKIIEERRREREKKNQAKGQNPNSQAD